MFNRSNQTNKTPKGAGVHKNDTKLISGWDIPLALVLLTRLPVPRLPDHVFARQAQAAWAFPIAGLAVGIIACLVGWIAISLNVPALVSAGLLVGVLISATGAMHEDGLADTADGLWGGFTRDRRLEIMKDSHIGTYGVLALLFSQLIRVFAVASLLTVGGITAILTACVMSRAMLPVLMAILPNARSSGLSHSVGRPRPMSAIAGLIVACAVSVALIGGSALFPVLFAALIVGLLAIVAKAKIGGQTGDILGAAQQLAEVTILVALIARL